MTYKHAIAFAVCGLLAGFLMRCPRDIDTSELDELVRRNAKLEQQIIRADKRADSLYLVAIQAKSEHLPDTVYETITRNHDEKIIDIINLDLNGQLREFARWTTEADSLRRRYADTDRY